VSRLRTVAIVLAGGVGTRVGLHLPKQLIKIAGRPIIEHTIVALSDCPLIDEIYVMMTPSHLDAVRAIVRSGGYEKVTQILEGGATRNESTAKALAALPDEDCNILIHDAVRPLVNERILRDCVDALQDYAAVDTAIPSADTVIQVAPAGRLDTITDVLVRHQLRRGQTPQAFRASVLKKAYALAADDPEFTATDDCTVVLRYLPDVPIAVVPGDEGNMKVTEPIDVFLADKLFQLSSHTAPALHPDALRDSLVDKVVVIFGGSYGIGADIATLASANGAHVHVFSRSATGTHVERREEIVAARDAVLSERGRIDYVINTAGVLPRGTLSETSEETVYTATEINYIAPVIIAQEFYAALRESRGGLLLFTSSSYTRGRSGYSLYSSAKAAVVNLVQALADEWSGDGIRVNCINPERTATPMRTQAFGFEAPETLLSSRQVAEACLEAIASTMTGHVIDVRRADPLAPDPLDPNALGEDEPVIEEPSA
jgi:2-C-methyl-D-erythritol 4-phosphate cytidylyltransferase